MNGVGLQPLTRQVYNGHSVFIAAILSVYQYFSGKQFFWLKQNLDKSFWSKKVWVEIFFVNNKKRFQSKKF